MAFDKILIATGDEGIRFQLNALLNELPDDVVANALPRCEGYAELVVSAHADNFFQLVIVDQRLRSNPHVPPQAGSDCAINLVKTLSQDDPPPAILFLSHDLREDEVEELFHHGHSKWLGFSSTNFADNFQNYVRQLANQAKANASDLGNGLEAKPSAPVVEGTDSAITLEFDFSNPCRQSCNVYYHDVFGAAPNNSSIDLDADDLLLKRFVRRSEEFEATHLNNPDLWLNGLRDLGEDASQIIFQNYDAKRELTNALELCNGRPESLKIRFCMSPDQHPGLYEAAIAAQNDDYLMVKATTARRVNIGTESRPSLNWCKRNGLSILAIESLVGPNDVIKGAENVGLSDLRGPVEECEIFDTLREAVSRNEPWSPAASRPERLVKVALGDVTVLRGTDGVATPLKQRIREELEDRKKQYDIVHYSGHSICHDGMNPFETSRLIVPTAKQGFAESINMHEFTSWLSQSGVQFVYLSSCKSAIGGSGSRAAVAEALAREAIPACLGFRWDIDDGSATEIARIFYHSLLCETQTLDEALMKARQEVYLSHRDDTPIWAAPVLFVQSRHWNTGQNPANRIPAAVA